MDRRRLFLFGHSAPVRPVAAGWRLWGAALLALALAGCAQSGPSASAPAGFVPPRPWRELKGPQAAFDQHKILAQLAISADNQWLAGLYRNFSLTVWQMESGAIRHHLELGLGGEAVALSFHPRLPLVAAFNGQGQGALVALDTGAVTPIGAGLKGWGGYLADGRLVAGGRGRLVYLDGVSGKPLGEDKLPSPITPTAIRADGRGGFVFQDREGKALFWRFKPGGALRAAPGPAGAQPQPLALSPDGRQVALRLVYGHPTAGGGLRLVNPNRLLVYGEGGMAPQPQIAPPLPATGMPGRKYPVDLSGVVFGPDGRHALGLVAPGFPGVVFQLPGWQGMSLDEGAYRLMATTPGLAALAFSPDGQYVAGVANFQWPNPDIYKTVGVYRWEDWLAWLKEKTHNQTVVPTP